MADTVLHDTRFFGLGELEGVEGMTEQERMKQLEELCKPVVEWLKENYHPLATVVITDSMIRVVEDDIGIPVGAER